MWTIRRHCSTRLECYKPLKVGIRERLSFRHPSLEPVYHRDRSYENEAHRKCQLGHLRFVVFVDLSLFMAYIKYGGMRELRLAGKPLRDDYVAQ